jgi:hypothetical protein
MQLPWPQHDNREDHAETRQPAAAATASAGTKAGHHALMPQLALLMSSRHELMFYSP